MNTNILRAICDRTRLKLLEKIGRAEVCACALPAAVGRSQPAVSQHLKVLLKAGLVNMRKDGKKRLYSLSQKGGTVVKDVSRW